ncbi:alpha-hydroxy acid oxidase [Runella salmonicolor]|uniref:Alpha-hydroxy-acid oxidizing protein n=1 Tax=Runella salmonicolor TaxID=2950278 RepID=A0ABT1FKC1_9BACT|nr:alpha-hydroxy acid oxidase [Runella salmonicolor]MCP1381223.1 alpha-hydroxy-acid oxidizing protein [Runella salmonicolor]
MNQENELEMDKIDISQIVNLFDFEKLAVSKMANMAYEYVASGAADEFTVRWNRQALDAIKLNPTVLVDVSQIDTSTSLLGLDLSHPILIAPTAYHKIMHPEGELATARGAGDASAVYVVSSFTTTPLEEITRVATQPLWLQLYVRDDRHFTKDLVQEAEYQGCRALCITVDTPVAGARNRQQRVNFALPHGIHTPHMQDAFALTKSLTWKDIEWLKSFAKIPVLLKGILNPEDAEKAVQSGVSGIIVSNHSGRNLDTVPATIEALPRIAEKVNKRIPILMDGGIRRGTDVLKAIALGANAVLVGKPICFGLACGGAEGVTKVLEILRNEFELAMALTGKTTIASIDSSVIWK